MKFVKQWYETPSLIFVNLNEFSMLSANIYLFHLYMQLGLHYINKYRLLMHCIKIKSPANFLLNEQYVFVGGNISFLCVLSCSSEET